MNNAIQPSQRRKTLASKLASLFIGFSLIVLVGWALIVAIAIYVYSQQSELAYADVAIVLGAGTREGRLSSVFRERIDHAVDLYQRGFVNVIILTGGVGQGQLVSDSEIARQYALENNIPADAILVDKVSETTLQNLEEAQRLMSSASWETALVISDPLHMYRAMAMANDIGINSRSSPTPTSRINSIWSNAYFLFREVVLVFQYSLLGN